MSTTDIERIHYGDSDTCPACQARLAREAAEYEASKREREER